MVHAADEMNSRGTSQGLKHLKQPRVCECRGVNRVYEEKKMKRIGASKVSADKVDLKDQRVIINQIIVDIEITYEEFYKKVLSFE